jgi:ferrochelatase
MSQPYDALLVLSFGGPEGPDDVMPFLENVLRGRNVPHARMLEVAEHYQHFGGKSPINDQNRALIAAIRQELDAHGPRIPIYWGNRNWHPFLADTLRQMRDDGIQRAAVFVTSAFSSYSGCRQYREDLAEAAAQVGEGVPQFDKLRVFYNHPSYIGPVSEMVATALLQLPDAIRDECRIVFTAHSIPEAMAAACRYQVQLGEACRLVARRVGREDFDLVYQSRSGPPQVPWLGPDINEHLETLAAGGVPGVVVMPIGFISDHMEVMYDLDDEARKTAERLGLAYVRAHTVGTHPEFVKMIRELVVERQDGLPPRAEGLLGANHDVCPAQCCLPGHNRPLKPAMCQRPAEAL